MANGDGMLSFPLPNLRLCSKLRSVFGGLSVPEKTESDTVLVKVTKSVILAPLYVLVVSKFRG